MRVGLVIYGSLDLVSGGFLYDRMLVRELRAAGVEVSVIALPWRRYGGALAENLQPWPAIDCDLVLQDQLIHPAVFARNDGFRQPVVALVHNLTFAPGTISLPAAVERRYFQTVDGVIAVCADSLAQVHALAPGLPGVVARPGRDHIPAEAPDLADGPLRLLFVATVMPHKGLHRLLDALAPLPPRWSLDVVGSLTADPVYAARVRETAPECVRWHGQLQGDALWALYRSSHLFVLPSDREAYSLACLEALGFGLPVLVTNRGGMGEMIAGEEGLTLPPDRPEAWTTAIARMMVDRPRLKVMSAAARARFDDHGTWRQTAAAVERFLRAVLAGSPRDLH